MHARISSAGLAFIVAVAAASPAFAAPDRSVSIDHSRQYAACMKLAHTHPQDAVVSGNAWRVKGGGPAAEHCIAIGLFSVGASIADDQSWSRDGDDD